MRIKNFKRNLYLITRSKSLEILFALRKGAKNFSRLADDVKGSRSTVKQRIDQLNKLKLITVKKSSRFPFRTNIELTKKGNRVLEKIEALMEILKSASTRF